jgi:ADP-ribosyl-[dinitrogen reductase] hydrolase
MKNDAALGTIFGALTGDAAGAVLEFFGREITEIDVADAMTMPGGGVWNVAPGQVTDDGELTMSLLEALAEEPNAPTEASAKRYARWVESDPFDIGATTAASLGCLRRHEHAAQAKEHGAARVMSVVALARCMGSKANGSLMRATPLAVWGMNREPGHVLETAMADARLSHPNPACVGSTIAYVMAIRDLLRGGTPETAFVAAEQAANQHPSFDEPRTWLAEARSGMRVPYTPLDGFVRIGFTHAFRHLLAGTAFQDAIAETLLGGGDTDTNACIVGGLLGARDGFAKLPAAMTKAVMDCTPARPDFLHPSRVPELVARMT